MAVIKLNQQTYNISDFLSANPNTLIQTAQDALSNFRANSSLSDPSFYPAADGDPAYVFGVLPSNDNFIYTGSNLSQAGPINPANGFLYPNANPTITFLSVSGPGSASNFTGSSTTNNVNINGFTVETSGGAFGTIGEANGIGVRGIFTVKPGETGFSGKVTEIGNILDGNIVTILGVFDINQFGAVINGTISSITFAAIKINPLFDPSDPFGVEDYYLYNAQDLPITNPAAVSYSATGLTLNAANFFTNTWGQITTLPTDDLTEIQSQLGILGGNDNITGSAGDDILEGFTGIDTLTGGNGSDTYYVDIAKVGVGATATIKVEDTVTEGAGLLGDVDKITLTNDGGLIAAEFTATSTITMAANVEDLDANALADFKLNITGNASNNNIRGNNTANILDGAAGLDTLEGDAGDDTYMVDLKTGLLATATNLAINDFQDTVAENGTDTGDTVKLRGSATFTAPATINMASVFNGIENLDVSATGATKLNLLGTSANNYLTGNTAINTLDGGEGNDTLDGGVGADSMDGGSGDDTYYIDNVGDVITDSDGVDTAFIKLASGAYVLAAGSAIENISIGNTAALNLTGNGTANRLTGNAAANILDGNGGIDTLIGGDGADTYITDGDDTITETNALAAGGIDTVKSSDNYTLGANVENLTIIDTIDNVDFFIIAEGNALANTIKGHSSNNALVGGAGKDTLIGGKGDDVYQVNLVKIGTGATATVGLEDTIIELAGTVEGARDRIYLANLAGDTGFDPNGISTTTTLTLAANIEALQASDVNGFKLNLTGNTADNYLIGNDTANVLLGLTGNDTLVGGEGNDTLDGGAGNDTLDGGDDDDTYIVDLSAPYTQLTYASQFGTFGTNNLQDDVFEDAGEGNDTLKIRGTFSNTGPLDLLAGSYYANVEGLDISLTGAAKINLNGNGDDNNLVGNAGTNAIIGDDGNDTLDGGAGIDVLIGGNGNDTYGVDNIGDNVSETGTDANDTIRSSIAINLNSTVSATDLTLKYANIEHVTLTGAAALNITGDAGSNILRGNDGANIIAGGISTTSDNGNDFFIGGKGNDTYIVENTADIVTEDLTAAQGGGIDTVKSSGSFTLGFNLENLTLTGTNAADATGNELANTIIGNTGNNVITGGAGKDALTGGKGDDTYFVDLAQIGTGATATVGLQDTVTELANPATPAGNNIEGTDIIRLTNLTGGVDANGNAIALNASNFITTSTLTLGANIERIYAVDAAGFKLNLTGNTLNNWLDGNNMANVLLGLAGDDELVGYAGDDILDGGIGNDTLSGGTGNDTYIVDMLVTGTGATSNFSITDVIEEGFDASDTTDTSAGIDTIKLRGTINYGTTYIETLSVGDSRFATLDGIDVSLTGATRFNLTGNGADNNLVGNAFTNVITGGNGNNMLDGGTGNDTLNGGDDNDTLIGGAGVDSLTGGNGDDTYNIDTLTDIIVDSSGNDTLQAAFSLSLQNTLANAVQFNSFGLEIDNLTLLGTGAINATGNANRNILTGNDGANILDGAGGDDVLIGGKGADTYIVNMLDGADIVTESLTILQGGGIDLVKSNGDFTLGDHLENLTLTDGTVATGSGAFNGTGNSLNNTIIGNAGDNELFGENGNDTLTGGAGSDVLNGGLGNDILNGGIGLDFYTFDTTLNALTNKDTIQGFSHADDTIELSQAIFGSLVLGTLNAGNYRVGTAALDANDFIINNAGNLYYDADGSGTGFAAVQFATLTGTVGIVGADDFIVF